MEDEEVDPVPLVSYSQAPLPPHEREVATEFEEE